jgi:uroporphyrinogen-III synthase
MKRKKIPVLSKPGGVNKDKQNALNALTAICGVVISGASMEDSLCRIALITSETMNARACSVMAYDSENQKLSVLAAQGAGARPNIDMNAAASLPGNAIKEKRVVTSAEKGNEPILPGTKEFSDIKSMISAPLMYKGEPIGVINTYVSEKHSFSEDEKATMRAIADQAAAVIQMARYMKEADEAKEALKTRKIVEKAKGILMRQRYMTEEQAYSAMRSKSMDTGKTIKAVAEAIIMTNEIKGKHRT